MDEKAALALADAIHHLAASIFALAASYSEDEIAEGQCQTLDSLASLDDA